MVVDIKLEDTYYNVAVNYSAACDLMNRYYETCRTSLIELAKQIVKEQKEFTQLKIAEFLYTDSRTCDFFNDAEMVAFVDGKNSLYEPAIDDFDMESIGAERDDNEMVRGVGLQAISGFIYLAVCKALGVEAYSIRDCTLASHIEEWV